MTDLSIPLVCGVPVIIRGHYSFLIASIITEKFPLLIETDDEEIVKGMKPGCIIAVSAPEGGDVMPALYLLEMVKTYHTPIIALSKTHPAAKRLSYVISADEQIEMRCDINRGTHKEQNILCAADEFIGMSLHTEGNNLIIKNAGDYVTAGYLKWNINFKEEKI